MSRGKSNTKNWRRNDRLYREQERARRKANAQRRAEVAEAQARGIPLERLRAERLEAQAQA